MDNRQDRVEEIRKLFNQKVTEEIYRWGSFDRPDVAVLFEEIDALRTELVALKILVALNVKGSELVARLESDDIVE